jgi:hypothetical protein
MDRFAGHKSKAETACSIRVRPGRLGSIAAVSCIHRRLWIVGLFVVASVTYSGALGQAPGPRPPGAIANPAAGPLVKPPDAKAGPVPAPVVKQPNKEAPRSVPGTGEIQEGDRVDPESPGVSNLGSLAGGAAGTAAALPALQGDTTWGGRAAFPQVIAPALVATPTGLPVLNNSRDNLLFSGSIPPNFTVDNNGLPASLKSADLVLGMIGLQVPNTNSYIPFGAMLLSSPIIGYDMINWAENGSILPQDRIFFDYRHFDAVGSVEILDLYGPDPANGHPNAYFSQQQYTPLSVDRFCVGIESTFGDGLWSIEARLPFQSQAAAAQSFNPGQSLQNSVELGNIGLAVKRYLVQGERWNVTGGLGLQLPTAPSTNLTYNTHLLLTWNDLTADLHESLTVKQSNETVWLNPFVGVSYNSGNRLFSQGMAQLCVPLNRSSASLTTTVTNGTIDLFGIPVFDFNANPLNQTTNIAMAFETLFRANAEVGYWVYQNPSRKLNSIAAILEVDDTNTLGNRFTATVVNLGPQVVMNIGKTEVAAGMLVPVSNDDAYKSEFTFRVNRQF